MVILLVLLIFLFFFPYSCFCVPLCCDTAPAYDMLVHHPVYTSPKATGMMFLFHMCLNEFEESL